MIDRLPRRDRKRERGRDDTRNEGRVKMETEEAETGKRRRERLEEMTEEKGDRRWGQCVKFLVVCKHHTTRKNNNNKGPRN